VKVRTLQFTSGQCRRQISFLRFATELFPDKNSHKMAQNRTDKTRKKWSILGSGIWWEFQGSCTITTFSQMTSFLQFYQSFLDPLAIIQATSFYLICHLQLLRETRVRLPEIGYLQGRTSRSLLKSLLQTQQTRLRLRTLFTYPIERSDIESGSLARLQKGQSNHSEGYYNELWEERLQIKTQT
jgi:hypothetical protein